MTESETHRDAVEQINEIREEFEHAENAGLEAFQRVIEEYTADDSVAIPPGRRPNVGQDAGLEAQKEFLAAFDVEVEYRSEEIVVGEELAFDRMTVSETHHPKDGSELIEHSGDSIWLYRGRLTASGSRSVPSGTGGSNSGFSNHSLRDYTIVRDSPSAFSIAHNDLPRKG